jgi:lantibiotic modifying enzyme
LTRPDFFSLVEAASGLSDRLGGKYFVPIASRFIGANACCPEQLQVLLQPVRLRNRRRLPPWARELNKMLTHFEQIRAPHRRQSELLNLCELPVHYARKRLRKKVPKLEQLKISPVAMARLEDQLRGRLIQTARSCFEIHLSAIRTVKRVSAETGLPRFANRPLLNVAGFLQNFPALARLWSQLILDWMSRVTELAQRLAQDRQAITRNFFSGSDPGRLIALQGNLSDPHCGGREVFALEFERGRVVYKPRDSRSEHEWFKLLRWINRQGFPLVLKIPRLVRRSTHSWMEFLPSQSCRSEAAVRRFYRRAGALTLAAYLVRAIDCHRGNVIASGEQPILIDVETLMHDEIVTGKGDFDVGIFRSGLLPLPRACHFPRYDYSAFGDRGRGPHRPTFDGKIVAARNYVDEITSGFRVAWNLTLCDKIRRKSLRRRLRMLAAGRWRRVYRPTASYIAILEASITPISMRSGAARIRLLGQLCVRQNMSNSVVLQEMLSLERFDVPLFLGTARGQTRLPLARDLSKAIKQLRSSYPAV